MHHSGLPPKHEAKLLKLVQAGVPLTAALHTLQQCNKMHRAQPNITPKQNDKRARRDGQYVAFHITGLYDCELVQRRRVAADEAEFCGKRDK